MKPTPASETLEQLAEGAEDGRVTVGELTDSLHERGFGLLMLVFNLPNCVPFPAPPGLPTIFSVPLLFLSVQMLLGRDAPWLPRWLRTRELQRSFLNAMVRKVVPLLRKVERLLHPRLGIFCTKTGERLISVFWLAFAMAIALPLPLSNFLPGVGIGVSALGLLARDGMVIVLGILIGCVGIALTVAVAGGAIAGLGAGFEWLAGD